MQQYSCVPATTQSSVYTLHYDQVHALNVELQLQRTKINSDHKLLLVFFGNDSAIKPKKMIL